MLPPWHVHVDVWLVIGSLGAAYWYLGLGLATTAAGGGVARPDGNRPLFYTGLLLLLVVSNWPLHDLAEESLYSVHMTNHLVMTLVAPPLLLLGLNRQMADQLFGHRLVLPWLRYLGRPGAAFAHIQRRYGRQPLAGRRGAVAP